MKTIRRNTLKKMIKDQKLVLVGYRYASDSEYDKRDGLNEECCVQEDNNGIVGVWNIPARHFTGSYGGAYEWDDGSIHLYCGCTDYTFRRR